MGLLNRLFGRGDDDGDEPDIRLDQELRKRQLLRLEKALDQLVEQMRGLGSLDNPGWRVRVNEYARLAGDAMTLRRGEVTREGVLDLVFEIRPLFSGAAPEGQESLVELQDRVLTAAEELRQLAPSERG